MTKQEAVGMMVEMADKLDRELKAAKAAVFAAASPDEAWHRLIDHDAAKKRVAKFLASRRWRLAAAACERLGIYERNAPCWGAELLWDLSLSD